MSQATTEPLVKAELEEVLSRLRSDGRLEDGTRLEERLLHLLGAKGFPKAFQTQAKRLANFCRKLEDGDADMASGLRRLEEGLSKLLLGWPMSEAPSVAVAHPPAEPPPPPEPPREARGLLEIFLQGQVDRLQELEVLCLEREKGNPGALPRIQGALHNLKGEFGVLGMSDWADLVHEVESLVAEDRLETDALLALVDMLGTHASELAKGRFLGVDPGRKSRLGLVGPASGPAPIPSPPVMPESALESVAAPRGSRPDMPSSGGGSCAPWMQDPSFLADFVTESMEHIRSIETALLRLETEPAAEDSLHSAFRAFHTIKGLAAFLKLPRIRELAHAAESVLDLVRKHELALTSAHVDILLVAADALCTTIRGFDPERARDGRIEPEAIVPVEILDRLRHPETIVPPPVSEFPESVEPLGRMLVKSGIASDAVVGEALDRQVGGDDRPLGEILVQEMHLKAVEVGHLLGMQARQRQHLTCGVAGAEPPPAAPAPSSVQDPGQKEGSPRTEVQGAVEDSIRVPVDRLDMLIDAIGEAVIAQSMVFADPRIREAGDLALEKKMAQSAVMLRRIQELSMSLRMVAIRQTFQKMARLVRDLSRKQGKLVDLELEGESTELDKTVVENIGDPLVHMIRNAVDHGLESPEVRRQAGKSEHGRIVLRAYHKSGSVFIEIEDDGKGLDKDRILAKAIASGVAKPGQELSEQDVLRLIFHPGLSTAEKVTDISGRGVGMDVVKRNIEALRGSVDIRSVQGKGTCFTIRLPLTLAIIGGMTVRVAGERYIVPTLSVHATLKPEPEAISTVGGKGEVLDLRGSLLPLVRLHDRFELRRERAIHEGVVLVIEDAMGRRVGLVADEILDQQQVVVKSLGSCVASSDIAGAAIQTDGTVSLILDVSNIVRGSREE